VAATHSTTVLTLDGASGTPSGNYQFSLSASTAGATSQAPTVITLSISPDLVAPASFATAKVGSCGTASVPIAIDVGVGLAGPVSLTLDNTALPPGLSASFSPAQATVTSGVADTHLDLSSSGGGASTSLGITASLPNGSSTTFVVPVEQVGPQVTSVVALGATVAYTPRAQKPGTTVEVSGSNYCSTATVAFGNDQATVSGTVYHNNLYDYLRVTTPRDATTGPVTVTAGSPPVSGSLSQALSVDSYRNVEAFNFLNFFPLLSFQDLTEPSVRNRRTST
jgi:hypothetical protein